MVHVHTRPADEPAIDPKRRYLCRHVFTDGHRCGSPSLRGQELCYYHRRTREGEPIAHRTGMFVMPRIDDRAALHLAIYDILARISSCDIDWKRGAILLRGLQIASTNLAHQDQPTSEQPPQIEDVTTDHVLGDLAPIVEIPDALPAAPTQNSPRQYTVEEVEYLRQTATLTGYAPGQRRRPLTLAEADIVAAINNHRRTAGLPPLGDEPGWHPSESSAESSVHPAGSPLPTEVPAPPQPPATQTALPTPTQTSAANLDGDEYPVNPADLYPDWDDWTPEERADAQDPAKRRQSMEVTERFFAEYERAHPAAAAPSLALAAVHASAISPPAAIGPVLP